MRKTLFALFLLFVAPVMGDLPSYDGWPKCLPVLGFSSDDIGVAAYETFGAPKPVQRWVCLVIDRATLVVTPIEDSEFDGRFPGVRLAGNHASNDCQEMTKTVTSPPPPGDAPAPTCIDLKVLCAGREIPVAVGSAVPAVRCPGRVFSAASIIDGNLWAAVNPLDEYYRELDGSDVVVQSVSSRTLVARRRSSDIGGRSVCAIRKDPVSGHVWATTETGLVEMRTDGAVIRLLRFRATRQPMLSVQKKG